MALLPFITDEKLYEFTKELVDAALKGEAKVEKNPYVNVIDPFSALIDSARQNITLSEWMVQEKSRQIQKSFQNAVGDFHQHILGAVPGWEDAGDGGSYDVMSARKKVIAEVKNKYNTMNSGAQLAVYDKLASWIDYGKTGYTAYVVDVVPKNPKPYCLPFTPSERKVRRQTRENLLRIDGRSFYSLATGHKDALDQLYNALPKVLEEILGVRDEKLTSSTEFDQLFEKAYIKK
ncbi:MAG: Eco47II family restriction endonuclease [Candidatus Saccharimonadales bacterium]